MVLRPSFARGAGKLRDGDRGQDPKDDHDDQDFDQRETPSGGVFAALFAYLFMAFPILFPWAENFTSLSPIHSARCNAALANPRDATSAHSADDDSAGRLSQLRG